jgi:hypothetical protein
MRSCLLSKRYNDDDRTLKTADAWIVASSRPSDLLFENPKDVSRARAEEKRFIE